MEPRKRIFKFRIERVEGTDNHAHVTVFSGLEGTTFANCGQLVFRSEEWRKLRQLLVVSYELSETLRADIKIEGE